MHAEASAIRTMKNGLMMNFLNVEAKSI